MFRRQLLFQSTLLQRIWGPATPANLCLKCRALSTRIPAQSWTTRLRTNLLRSTPSIRWHSVPANSNKVYDFAAIQEISHSPKAEQILIDVREPSEYEVGFIPSAINIPVKTQPDALFLSDEEFEDRFGFQKPPLDAEVIFYCKSGVRSSAAAHLARQHGYTNVAEYRGSWLDWTARDGKAATP